MSLGLYAAWRAGVKVRINESISMAHKADKKTILKNILKPFSKCFQHTIWQMETCAENGSLESYMMKEK